MKENALKPMLKKSLSIIACILASVALIGVACTGMSARNRIAESEKTVIAKVSAEIKDVKNEVAAVRNELDALKGNVADNQDKASARIEKLEQSSKKIAEIEEVVARLDSQVAVNAGGLSYLENLISNLSDRASEILDVKFEKDPYPVRYMFTEDSLEEFKGWVLDEILPLAKAELDVSEEEYATVYEEVSALDPQDILDLFDFPGIMDGIEVVDEDTLIADGYENDYEVVDGKLYVEGEPVGTMDDKAIVLSIEEQGVTVKLAFYRDGAPEYMGLIDKINQLDKDVRNIDDTEDDVLEKRMDELQDQVDECYENIEYLWNECEAAYYDLLDAVEEAHAEIADDYNNEIDYLWETCETTFGQVDDLLNELHASVSALEKDGSSLNELKEKISALNGKIEDYNELLEVKIMNENSRLREQLVYKINQLSTAVNEADSMLKTVDSAIIAGNKILEDRVIALEGFAAGYGF